MKFTINQIGTCQDCEKHLVEHPSLRVTRVTEINRSMNTNKWKHTTRNGVMLHNAATRTKPSIN